MLSNEAQRVLINPLHSLIDIVGGAENVKATPAQFVDASIECCTKSGRPDLANEFATNRTEAEQMVGGCLGMM